MYQFDPHTHTHTRELSTCWFQGNYIFPSRFHSFFLANSNFFFRYKERERKSEMGMELDEITLEGNFFFCSFLLLLLCFIYD